MWLPHSEFSGVKDQGGLPVTAEYNILVTIGEKNGKDGKKMHYANTKQKAGVFVLTSPKVYFRTRNSS